jgi:aminomethyltransferase
VGNGEHTLTATPFDSAHRELPGAEFAEWEGWSWVAGFGDAVREHEAVRRACGVWDESPLQKWELRGPDATAVADRWFTNDVRSLQPGQLRYGAFCDDNGAMLGDGTVFRFGPDRLLAVTALPADRESLEAAAAGTEVEIECLTERMPHLQLQGPTSRDVLQSLASDDVSTLGYYRFLLDPLEVAGVPVMVARCGYSGELGYELYCAPEHAETLWRGLLDTGHVTPYGLNAIETLRQESGLIFIGYDYFAGETDPYEVGLDRVVKLDKPGFRGRDALRSIAASPRRRITTLVIDGDDVPEYGARVTRSGAEAGVVRSPSFSPTLHQVIALAVLDHDLTERGTQVDVDLPSGATARATVDSYPIYDPDKLRPRA